MSMKILIIEDEEKIARILSLECKHEGYTPTVCHNGKDGLQLALSQAWDIILLDVMLPEMNGMEVLRKLRLSDQETPVILLTARGSTIDKVNGLDHGANDYVTKPFEMEELLARIRAVTRTFKKQVHMLQLGDLEVHRETREVIRAGVHIELTPREFELLSYLLSHPNRVFTREQLLEHVWGYDYVGETNVVDVYIRYLRKKIDYPFPSPLIHTIRGVGYTMKELKE